MTMNRNESDPFIRKRLFCPGPTPIPKFVEQAGEAVYYHRSSEFNEVFLNCRKLLAPFFGSKHLPYLLTASGTGAMEAAVSNLTDLGDEVIVVSGGKFGERWAKLTQVFGCNVLEYKFPYGQSPDGDELLSLAKKHKNAKALFMQANETSTGVYYPLASLLPKLRREFSGLIVVDAISALGAHEIKMDEWGIDCLVAASQKGFGVAPGLAFVALSAKASAQLSKRPRFYFDLRLEAAEQDQGNSAFTPATTLIQSMNAALNALNDFGLKNVYRHHQILADATRAAAKALNLQLYPSGNFSNAVTAIRTDKGLEAKKIIQICRQRFGAIVAGGQGSMKGEMIRLAHLGFVDHLDVVSGIAALEFALKEIGHKFDMGAGVGAAMNSISKSL